MLVPEDLPREGSGGVSKQVMLGTQCLDPPEYFHVFNFSIAPLNDIFSIQNMLNLILSLLIGVPEGKGERVNMTFLLLVN